MKSAFFVLLFTATVSLAGDIGSPLTIDQRMSNAEADIAAIKAKLGMTARTQTGAYRSATGHIYNAFSDGSSEICANCPQPASFGAFNLSAEGSPVFYSTAHATAATLGVPVRSGSIVTTPDGSTVRSRRTPVRAFFLGR